MEMSGQLQSLAVLPSGKGFPEPIDQISGWVSEPIGKVLRKVPFPMLGIKSRFLELGFPAQKFYINLDNAYKALLTFLRGKKKH